MELHDLIPIQYQGIIPLAIGLLVRLIIGYRRFNRRGVAGLQHFNNYFVGLLVTFVEWLFSLAAWIAILWGLFLLLTEWLQGTLILNGN
ncbi:hypothetical protein [Olivibacter jilunii]|uniref:hypothetical protein n=1 Tax=Olivibacter jilunii TaxID=985016 RepID=UPI00102FBB35|nr:hypothetical protein [Olivibacter jilunii]